MDGEPKKTLGKRNYPLSRRGFLKTIVALGGGAALAGVASKISGSSNVGEHLRNTEINMQSTLVAPTYSPEIELRKVSEAALNSSVALVFYNELSGSRRGASGNLYRITTLENGDVVASFITAAHHIAVMHSLEKFQLEIHADQFLNNPTVSIDPRKISTQIVPQNTSIPASVQDIGVVSVRLPATEFDKLTLTPFTKFATDDELRFGETVTALTYPAQLDYHLDQPEKFFVSSGRLSYSKQYSAFWMEGAVAGKGSSGGGVFIDNNYVGLIYGHGDGPNSILIARTSPSIMESLVDSSVQMLGD